MALALGQVELIDPLDFVGTFWPDVYLYGKQREIMYSLVWDDETVVHAGNMLGKDFTAALAVIWFFCSRHPCRVLTTSVDGTQLESVLWGEIREKIQTSNPPLDSTRGGPLVVNHLHIRKLVGPERNMCGLSYVRGRVAAKGEGMLGHHVANVGDGVPRTLFVADEASGVDDVSYERADTWAERKLIIGNPYNTTNFFRRLVRRGSVLRGDRRLEVPV